MTLTALVVGHHPTSTGAHNESYDVTEFGFNSTLAEMIADRLRENGNDVVIVYRDAYKDLPEKINKIKPSLVVSLHCNAFNKKASGTETLYYYKSSKSKSFATVLQEKVLLALGLADRGIRERREKERGGFLLKRTDSPCVIAEPFFLDNDKDLEIAQENMSVLANAYAEAIGDWFHRFN